jgi:hypothetical protein
MLPAFGDLYKPIKDALTKSYCGESHKLEVTAKADAVKFSPTFTRDTAGNISASFSVEGDYVPCKYAKTKLKYGVTEKGILSTKLTIDSMPKAKGLKLEAVADMGIGAELSKDKYELKAELKHDKATIIGSVKQDMAAEISCVMAAQDLQVGVQLGCNLSCQKLCCSQLGVAYKVNTQTTIACILENMTNTKSGFSTSANGWTWAAEYSVNTDGSNGTITLGAETTTKDGQTIKGRINTKGIIAAAVVHKLTPEMKLTSSIEVDSTKGFTSKWGATLAWEN